MNTSRTLVAVATGAGDAAVGGHFSLVALIAGLAVQVWQKRSFGAGPGLELVADGVTDGAAALVGQGVGRRVAGDVIKYHEPPYLGPPTPGDGTLHLGAGGHYAVPGFRGSVRP